MSREAFLGRAAPQWGGNRYLVPLLDSRPVTGMKKEGAASIGAMVLAFLASQHHNLHMVLLTLGLGGPAMTFMEVYPGIRRGMLLASLAVVVVNVRSLQRRPATPAMRVLIVAFSALTVGIAVWSLIRFGL